MTVTRPSFDVARAPGEAALRRVRIDTYDRDVALSALRGQLGDVRLDVTDTFEWKSQIVDLGPVTVACGHYEMDVALEFAPPTFMLSVLSAGSGRATYGRESAPIGPGGVALLSPGRRAVWSTAGEVRPINMFLNPSFLASELAALTGEIAQEPLVFEPFVRVDAGLGAYVERLCRFIASEIESGTILDQPAVAAGLLHSLARALLVGQPHNHTRLLERPEPPSSRTVARRVEDYIDAHAAEPIGAREIAQLAGAPVRSLEAAFRSHCGASPGRFLRSRRLELARRALLEDRGMSVPCVAHAAGFLRLDTFDAAYCKAFGERPGETRRRALLTGAPPRPQVDQGPSSEQRLARLSTREREVCARVAKGMLNKQIAADLGLSERTVKEYRAHAMAKLGARSAGELVALLR